MIEVKRVSHEYRSSDGSNLLALANVNISVQGVTTTAILGPSGSGKSTLLRCIGGLLRPSHGSVEVSSVDAALYRMNGGLGYLFQEDKLLPWRTVRQNLLLPFELGHPRLTPEERLNSTNTILELLELSSFENMYPSQLSGGMRRRLSLGRELVTEPAVLLLDEPLSGLDLRIRRELLLRLAEVIERIGSTCVLVTHDIEEAVFLSSTIFIFSERPGQVIKTVNTGFSRTSLDKTLMSKQFKDVVALCRATLLGIL